MVSDSYYKQDYVCTDCQTVQKHYVWSSELETTQHTCTNKQCSSTNLEFIEKHQVDTFQVGIKLNKSQIVADRKKRSKQHFVKEVMPTIGKKDRQHFIKKHGWKS